MPSSLLLAISSLVSRILGILRDRILATQFGAGIGVGAYSLDVYYVAFRLPDLLYNLLIYGTISAALLPIFLEHLTKKNRAEAWKFASSLLNLFGLILIVASVIIFILAPWIVPLLAPGMNPENLTVAISLTRIMLLSPIFFGLSSVLSALANAFKIFRYFAFAPIVYNLSLIISAYFGAEKFGVYALAFGVIVGAFLHFAIQIPVLWEIKFRWSPILGLQRLDIKKAFRLIIPRLASLSLIQINLMIEMIIASLLGVGSITILNLAYNLHSLPVGIIGISIALPAFTTLSEFSALGDNIKFTSSLKKNITSILRLVIPASVGLFLLAPEIVNLILFSGKFSVADTNLTANVLRLLLIGLFAYTLTPLLSRAFFARQNTYLPLLAAIIALIVNVIFALTLPKWLGLAGLGLANSLAGITNLGLLIIWLARNVKQKYSAIFAFSEHAKIIFLSAIMGLGVWYFSNLTTFWWPQKNFINILYQVSFSISIGLIIYFSGEKIFDLIYAKEKSKI